MKRNRIISSLLLVIIMVSAMTITAFAASSSKTFTSSPRTAGSMSLYLEPDMSGTSSIATISVTGLPKDATIKKVVVDCNTMSSSGSGAILSNTLFLKSSNYSEWLSEPWGSLNQTEFTTELVGTAANGTYQLYYAGTNVSSKKVASKTYNSIKLTVYYTY